MIVSSLMAGLVALGVALAPVQDPPPPYDWDGVAVEFDTFYAIVNPGGQLLTVYALYPEEGRKLCDYEQRYAQLGPLNCRVAPMSGQPMVDQPGWLNDWAANNGFPVVN